MNEIAEPDANSVAEPQSDYSWPFGAEHKRSRRIAGLLLLVVLVSPVVWLGFGGELAAGMWHLRHGNHFDFEGVRFAIPADRFVRCWSPRGCTVLRAIGYLRFRLQHPALQYVMFTTASSTGQAPARTIDEMRANAMRWRRIEERSLTMAGGEVHCLEYLQADQHTHTINCYSSDTPVHVTFMGSGDTAFFYQMLSSAAKL